MTNYQVTQTHTQLPQATQETQVYCQNSAPAVAQTVLEYATVAMGFVQVAAGVLGCIRQGASQMAAQAPAPAPAPVANFNGHQGAGVQALWEAETHATHAAPPPPPAPVHAQPVPPAPPAPPVYSQAAPQPVVFHTDSGRRII